MQKTGEFRRRHLERFGGPARLFAAPGRVNIIGEHTDYNDGFVLPVAIDRYTIAAITPCDAPLLTLRSEALDETIEVRVDAPFERRGSWTDYAGGVAQAVASDAPFSGGAFVTIGGDLPLGAGLSSSASFELALSLALYSLSGVAPGARRAAAAGSRAEHEFVGIRSGVMDQLICSLGIAGSALLIDCRSLSATPVALPAGMRIAVCDTTVKHALAGSEYNARREACEEGVRILERHGVPIRALRDLSIDDFERVSDLLPSPVRERCRHVVYEDARTIEAVSAMQAGELQALGRLLNESHRSLKELYEVSSSELDQIVEAAQAVPGVYGARMTGGGFGGAAIAVYEPGTFAKLVSAVDAAYYRKHGIEPRVFEVNAVRGAAPLPE